jgi:hypothetical protein
VMLFVAKGAVASTTRLENPERRIRVGGEDTGRRTTYRAARARMAVAASWIGALKPVLECIAEMELKIEGEGVRWGTCWKLNHEMKGAPLHHVASLRAESA